MRVFLFNIVIAFAGRSTPDGSILQTPTSELPTGIPATPGSWGESSGAGPGTPYSYIASPDALRRIGEKIGDPPELGNMNLGNLDWTVSLRRL